MAFPASTASIEEAWRDLRNQALAIEAKTQTLRDESAAGPTKRTRYRGLQKQVTDAIDAWDAIIAEVTAAELETYARTQPNISPTFDFNTEYTAMKTAAESLRTWIHANIPTHTGTGADLVFVYDANGVASELTFTTAQTADFRTECDAFVASII